MPSPVSFDMTLVLSSTPHAAMLVSVCLSLNPSAFGRRW
jgi:hypothetical protein